MHEAQIFEGKGSIATMKIVNKTTCYSLNTFFDKMLPRKGYPVKEKLDR